MQNAPQSLEDEKICFSYPISMEYPNTIAFSSVQSGILMAYSSSKLIIVLSHCKYIKAVLHGHKEKIMSLTFDIRGPNIVACDIIGNFYFWHYNDPGYELSRITEYGIPSTCISWFPIRRELSLSTSKGLLYGSSHDFGNTVMKKLAQRSTFCQFNYDGTILASHNNRKIVNLFVFSASTTLTFLVSHLDPVLLIDFHPYLPIFLSITQNFVLHIWRLANGSNFVCTTKVKIDCLCKFVQYPICLLEGMKRNKKSAKIAFVGAKDEIVTIKVDKNGKIENEKKINVDINSSRFGLVSVFKTNFGLSSVVIKDDDVLIHSKSGNNQLFHSARISQISFQKDTGWIFTIDEYGDLIVWPAFDTFYSSNCVSHNASKAVWLDEKRLLFVQYNQLNIYDVFTSKTQRVQFPFLKKCVDLYIGENQEIYILTRDELILNDARFQVMEFDCHSFSNICDGHFVLVLLPKSASKMVVYLLPEFTKIECKPHNGNIKSIVCISLSSFVTLDDEKLDFWTYSDDVFSVSFSIQMPKMNFVYFDSSVLFACDDCNLYVVSNDVFPILSDVNIACMTTDRFGNIAYSQGQSFFVINSPWQKSSLNNSSPKKFPCKVMVSPFDYVDVKFDMFNIVHSTLIHLLEYDSLFDFVPKQLPAVPNQCAFHLSLPKRKFAVKSCEFSLECKDYLSDIDQEKKDGFDLFALRYIYAIRETGLPLSYFALWLSFSIRQSEVAHYLIDSIDSSGITDFFVPMAIHDHQLLVSIVKAAVQRTWTKCQKVENVALFLISLGQQSKVSSLYSAIGDMQRSEFFAHDFSKPKYRKSALKNAYSSLSHGGYEMSAALFIIVGEIKTGMLVILQKINDPILGFLVMRLLTNSDYESELMKWFLSNVDWKDEIIPILVAKLLNDNNLIELFEKPLLEKDLAKNATSFGDRRVALFQIYHYLAKKQNLIPKMHRVLFSVAKNLCHDGLAPLAKYLYKFVECPYTVARLICMDSHEESEEERSEPEENIRLELNNPNEVKEISSFDFGGASAIVDDDYDNEWSDSDAESEPIPEVKLNSSSQIVDSNQTAEEIGGFDSITENEVRKQSFYLSSFFSAQYISINENNDIAEVIEKVSDKEAAHFALSVSNLEMAAKLSDNKMVFQIEAYLSRLILFFSTQFLYSASVSTTPVNLFNLCKILLKLTTKKDQIEIDYKFMKNNDKDGFGIFSFLGSFVVSMWTYHHKLLYKLLSYDSKEILRSKNNSSLNQNKNIAREIAESTTNISNVSNNSIINSSISNISKDPNNISSSGDAANTNKEASNFDNTNIDEIPPAKMLFNIDISPLRFPDTIPSLLGFYLNENQQGLEFTLERDRVLIIYLIYTLMLTKLAKLHHSLICNSPEEQFFELEKLYSNLSQILDSRKHSLLRIIEFYQFALNCPSLSPPKLPNDLLNGSIKVDPVQLFCISVIVVHRACANTFIGMQKKILKKLPLSFIFNWKQSIDSNEIIKSSMKVQYPTVKDFVVTPLNASILIAISSSYIFLMNLDKMAQMKQIQLNKINSGDEPLQIVSHPKLNLILVISSCSVSLYDFNNVNGVNVNINFEHHSSKFSCAKFSPKGEKIAICSSFVEVFIYDLALQNQTPFCKIQMNGNVNAVVWYNSDTLIIVAYISKEKGQKFALLNLLSPYILPIALEQFIQNSKINVMEFDRNNNLLLLGAKNGRAALVEMVSINDFRLRYFYDFKKTEVSAAAFSNNLFAFGTLDGDVLIVSLQNQKNVGNNFNAKLLKVQFPISSLIVEAERIIIAGNSNLIEEWKAKQYF